MILLTVIAVGLLSIASVSLRTSSHEDAASAARNNARLSLMLAIGALQKQMGPDTRISVTADQLATSGSPETPLAPEGQRQWTGTYKSWPKGLPSDARPQPEFGQWLISGNPNDLQDKNYALLSANDAVEIVTTNTVGPGETVTVPKLTQTFKNGTKNGFAWWVGDQGVKALIAPSKVESNTVAEVRADLQAMPTSHIQSAKVGASTPFSQVEGDDPNFARVHSWESAELLAGHGESAEVGGLFHDFTTHNRGLLTNVRAGGFRKDLSMELEKPTNLQPNPTTSALYTVAGEPGINMQELWAYYNLSSSANNGGKGLNWSSGNTPYTTGGSMPAKTPCLTLLGSAADVSASGNDDFFYYKQPVVINYQLLLSLKTEGNNIKIVADPIVTLWNPLDVPVVVPNGMFFSVKYWQVPYNLKIRKGATTYLCPVTPGTDSNIMSLQIGSGSQRVVFKPGEVVRMSQFQGSSAAPHTLIAKAGYNFGYGVSWNATDVNDTTARTPITFASGEVVRFEGAEPNDLTAGASGKDGKVRSGNATHTRHFSLTHHEFYLGTDRSKSGNYEDSIGIGGIYLDYDFGNRRLKPTEPARAENAGGTKLTGERYNALQRSNVFRSFPTDGRTITTNKMPVMLFSFSAKTEYGTKLFSARTLSRFNPKALQVDFYDLGNREREILPYEYSVEQISSLKNDRLDGTPEGQAYFGASMTSDDGNAFVTTHSVPREPIVSLAAFQHSFANGFTAQKPRLGYSTLNAREPLLPQISHAIGNSLACPVIDKDKTAGTAAGGRPLADHSYLANQALFDDWFLSGISPQLSSSFSPTTRQQKVVATQFFTDAPTGKLPVTRYIPNTRGKDPTTLANSFFSGSRPIPTTAAANIGSYIQVEGLFNVNSTSVEAWKSLLAGRGGRKMVTRSEAGLETIRNSDSAGTPVSGLFGPTNTGLEGSPSSLKDPTQWTGYRSLSADEIDSLARGIVREVRKRGPFISLADFINRRVGTNEDLARAGAIQNALDSDEVTVNRAFNTGSRASNGGTYMDFKNAEKGPKSYGIPGVVKQADILTPIAPILSARSDSFIIRGYGEKTDASGKILARAWCEAVVERGADFVDPVDAAEKAYDTINQTNINFGRQFKIVSFRWLNPSEA
ncbi:hypothetical protein GCM10023212_41640 [Luteolibacter yonseiensis]